jgi:hypothetical protein
MAKAGKDAAVKGGKEIVGYYEELRRVGRLLRPTYTVFITSYKATDWPPVAQLPMNVKN